MGFIFLVATIEDPRDILAALSFLSPAQIFLFLILKENDIINVEGKVKNRNSDIDVFLCVIIYVTVTAAAMLFLN